MTELLYQTDSYLKELQAIVTAYTDDAVVLDKTIFYPGGGGQPVDAGKIVWHDGEANIKKLKKTGDDILHWLDGPLPDVGEKVTCQLNWERRYQLMRTHTALHILCGVIWRDFGAQVTGGNMEPLKARMDFELESMSADFAERVEAAINKEVEVARPVQVKILPREEAFKIPDLIRNHATMILWNNYELYHIFQL